VKKEYVLKHKNLPVFLFNMDDETHKVLEGHKILEREHLPFNMQELYDNYRISAQADIWIQCRGLAESRKDLNQVKQLFGEKESKGLVVKSLGLNLTDHYWVHRTEDSFLWEKVNHFDNMFDTLIQPDNFKVEINGSVKNPSPNLCVDGSIVKRWMIKDNARVLLKGSRYGWMQEPFNEKIASMIMEEFTIEHVSYDVFRTKDGIPYSECMCMVDRDTEYINADWVFHLEAYGLKELYKHYIDVLERNGLKDVKQRVDEMIAIDFLIGNEDRHRGNFGIIRNAQTLKWENPAKIFDNGNSLSYGCEPYNIKDIGVDTLCKSFENSNRLMLDYIDYPEWWKNTGKNRVLEIVSQCLKDNEKILSERYDALIDITKKRIEVFEKVIGIK